MTWRYYEHPRPEIQSLDDPRGGRCLDVGCGAGALAEALSQADADHVRASSSTRLPPSGHAGASTFSSRATRCGSPLPFAEGEFGLIVFADALEHLNDPDAALERCLPYLAPGGTVVVSGPNMRFYLVLVRLLLDRCEYTDRGVFDQKHLWIFTRRSLQRMLTAHGLYAERIERKPRLLDDLSQVGRVGAAANRIAGATIARWPFRGRMAYQYVAVCRK